MYNQIKPDMSEKLKAQLGIVALFVGVISGVAGLLGAWVVIPYRVSALEIQQIENTQLIRGITLSAGQDHDLLVRIEERLIMMQKEVNKINK